MRTIVVGVLASIGTAILPLPATLAGGLSGSTTVAGVVYAAELVAITVVAVPVLYAQWQRHRSETPSTSSYSNPLILGYGVGYLAVMAVLWACALPAYLARRDGVTGNGDPTGSLWYTVVCFVVAGLCAAAALRVSPSYGTNPETHATSVSAKS